jgi:heme/copper-type cytochrome/quinol oxidase subunit 2
MSDGRFLYQSAQYFAVASSINLLGVVYDRKQSGLSTGALVAVIVVPIAVVLLVIVVVVVVVVKRRSADGVRFDSSCSFRSFVRSFADLR